MNVVPTSYGALVAQNGLAASHRQVIDLVTPGSRVLDVGCAEGYVAAELLARGCSVVGIERDPRAAAIARERGIEVLGLDVEAVPLAAARFDVVVFADVLEHLRDPVAVLRQALPAGRAVVSLPNVAHWTARRSLLGGRFPREGFGLFDRTHLRFYTRETAHELAGEAGFRVVAERFAGAPLPLESRFPALRRVRPLAVRTRPELFALQTVLELEPL
jgi:methionine biosynthesis protein MetW